ncbi:cytochrome P450 [Trinickia terrae]|uniref:Cytochrome P450 n=1 Tax=Trinickia terrae TaxID=2571161 RepID=A0A4U1IFG6_9BURK|nr:cytochrome P450 [Trinickia terrae]TKC92469.1 cytochrome P450 [Trinickia terrae]
MNPIDPIDAVAHADPYPYYAGLTANAPFVFEPRLRLWLAASAEAVTEVLAHPELRVRPAAEPVPKAIAGAPSGEVFARLARMNDGAPHRAPKLALQHVLGGLDLQAVSTLARGIAADSERELQRPGDLSAWLFETPVQVVASLLGFADETLPGVVAWMADFVACLSPLSTPEQLARANDAARVLVQRVESLVAHAAAREGTQGDRSSAPGMSGGASLVALVRREAEATGWEDADALAANLVGLLSQTYEATAGLIGNTVVALITQPGVESEVRRAPDRLAGLIRETSRFDSPVQNTRRFVAADTTVCGERLEAGAAILVLLAAANRDPAANARPHEFLLDRPRRRVFGFGHGMHACPGEQLAYTIASAAVGVLLERTTLAGRDDLDWSYRASANARLPVFTAMRDARPAARAG